MLCPYHFCPLLYPSLHEMSLQSSSVGQPCPAFCNPWTAASQASLSITNSWNLLKSPIELVMPSNHLILCHPLLLQPSIFFQHQGLLQWVILHIRWPKYWSFSFSISPSNEPWSPLGWTGWISFAVQGALKSLLQHHSSKASIIWHSPFFIVQL